MRPRITIMSVLVDDQARALEFYRDVLGFEVKHDIDMGGPRWLTLTGPDEPQGTELLLEPDENFGAPEFKRNLREAGVPFTQFEVDDVDAAHEELTGKGVRFTQKPMDAGPVRIAVLDDTCGNLIQLVATL